MLAKLGDSVTTDHISPAGSHQGRLPGRTYLSEHGVALKDFNSYGSRRGNHEVMIRGHLREHPPAQPVGAGRGRRLHCRLHRRRSTADHDLRRCAGLCSAGCAAGHSRRQGVRVGVVARLGGEGTSLLGVKVVIAESFERIHRSNLIGMGVLPLQFPEGENADSWG